MKKAFVYIAIVLLGSLMASCSFESYTGADMEEEVVSATPRNAAYVHANNNKEEAANIRVAMYETVQGYNVQISNVEFVNVAGTMEAPAFGSNLEGALLGTAAYAATYDTTDGSFAMVATGTEMQLIVRFDATLIAEDGSDAMQINGVTAALNEAPVLLQNGNYELKLQVNAATLNLQAIEFDATVTNPEEVTVGE